MKSNGIKCVCACILFLALSSIGEIVAQAMNLATLKQQYDSLNTLGDNQAAIEVGEKWLGIYQKKDTVFANMAENIATNYFHLKNLNNLSRAIDLSASVMEIRKQLLGIKHLSYATSLDNLATYYDWIGDYAKAIDYGTKAIEIREHASEQNYPDYANSLGNLSVYCAHIGKAVKAIELGTKAMEICRNKLGEKHPFFATSLSNLAGFYSDFGDFNMAIKLGEQATEAYGQIVGKNHLSYATSLDNLATYYIEIGDYYKAMDLATNALEIRKHALEQNHPDYANSLDNLAKCYSHAGNFIKSIEISSTAISIRSKTLGDTHPYFATSLCNLAEQYSDLGNYEKAVELVKRAKEIFCKTLGINHPHYATSLASLANNYSNMGNYAKAIELGEQANEIFCNTLGVNHPHYATSLASLANNYSNMGNYAKAIELGEQANEIFCNTLGVSHPQYAVSLGCLGLYYSYMGDYAKAIELMISSLKIEKSVLGFNHPTSVRSLQNLALLNFLLKDYQIASKLYDASIESELSFLSNNLSGLSSRERLDFWKRYKNSLQYYYPLITCFSYADSSLRNLYNNSCLFAKGLLLSAETEMRKLILESGDEAAVGKFEQLQTTRAWLNKLYEKPIAERHVNTDSLENVAERLETELVQMSKTYGDFMHNLKLTWKDVQNKLGDKDVAVEFLSFPVLNSDSTMYIALTVRKGYDTPHMVRLFEEAELKSIKSSYYISSELSKIVWGKMAEELEGVENIYFSPSGELYNIAIESMPHWTDSCMMSDRFNLYRLSSTRELAINRSETKSTGAVVYGGIQYDTDVALMGTPKSESDALYAYRSFDADATNYRGTNWQYLSGTMVEAEKVDSILTASKSDVNMISGNHATETTFKNLSGQKKNLLHIATHGFYWSESTAERKKAMEKLSFLQMGDARPRYVEDKAMTRSGLLFAGANNTFNYVEIPAGVDDGVLTAQEISQLDLRGLDLLVLSACQTGLGEIKGDGVFGLQRGFKKAGAQTIMMSLWEVSDEATKDLMTQFYTALTTGKTKREAFKQAQQYVKEHDADYGYRPSNLRSKRPHWAAFILLDALE